MHATVQLFFVIVCPFPPGSTHCCAAFTSFFSSESPVSGRLCKESSSLMHPAVRFRTSSTFDLSPSKRHWHRSSELTNPRLSQANMIIFPPLVVLEGCEGIGVRSDAWFEIGPQFWILRQNILSVDFGEFGKGNYPKKSCQNSISLVSVSHHRCIYIYIYLVKNTYIYTYIIYTAIYIYILYECSSKELSVEYRTDPSTAKSSWPRACLSSRYRPCEDATFW